MTYLCPMCDKWMDHCEHLRDLESVEAIIPGDDDSPYSLQMSALYKEIPCRVKFDVKPGTTEAIEGGCSCDPEKNQSVAYFDGRYWVNYYCPMHGKMAQLASKQ